MGIIKKMTITEALNELKLYDSKIEKAISGLQPIATCKKSAKNIGTYTKENFVTKIKSDYESVTSLIKNRNAIKSQVVKSNANTIIVINGVEMTVAEAIERKTSIEYDKNLLSRLKAAFAAVNATYYNENAKVDAQVNKMLESFLGKDGEKKITKEEISVIEAPYRQQNEFEFVDPLRLADEITRLEDEIMGFESSVDTALVVSNSTTVIDVVM